MDSFKEHIDEAQALKFFNLLPKKVRHLINRLKNQDKYKAALLMIKHLRKDPDVISRGLTKARIQGIAADHFGLNHREFAKVLNRQTRYEDVEDWQVNEAFTIIYKEPKDIKSLGYSPEQEKHIDLLYKKLKKRHDTPLIFDTKPDNKSKIKVFSGEFQKDGEKFLNSLTQGDGAIAPSLNRRGKGDKPGSTMLVFGSGSASQGETSIDASKFGINTKAGFFEFWQAIGLFISKPLTDTNFKKILLKLYIQGDFQIRTYIEEWELFIDYCELDNNIREVVIMLVNGSYYYRKTIKPEVTKPYVIWTGIKKYYSELKTKEGIEGSVKENTADCVLINGTEAELYTALNSDDQIKTDDDTGMLSCGKVQWYQISLKKAKDEARLGKLTKLLRGMYDTPANLDAAEVNDLFDEVDYDYEQVLQEGLFGDIANQMKEIGGDAFKKFKAGAVAVFKYWLKLKGFISKLAKKYEKDTMKEIERLTKKSLREQLILEKPTSKDMLSAIVDDDTLNEKYKKIIDKNYKDIAGIKIEDKYISTNMKKHKVEIKPTTVNFLVGNVISMKIIKDVIEDVNKNGIKVINTLNQSMSMGDTNLPVVKVYGTLGSSPEYEVITVGSINQKNPKLKNKQIKILKVAVQPYKKYYVINMWIFAELKEDGPHYHQVAFKKSGSTAFNYNIEGTATVPESKIKLFPVAA
jgi:hypothetical protein